MAQRTVSSAVLHSSPAPFPTNPAELGSMWPFLFTPQQEPMRQACSAVHPVVPWAGSPIPSHPRPAPPNPPATWTSGDSENPCHTHSHKFFPTHHPGGGKVKVSTGSPSGKIRSASEGKPGVCPEPDLARGALSRPTRSLGRNKRPSIPETLL